MQIWPTPHSAAFWKAILISSLLYRLGELVCTSSSCTVELALVAVGLSYPDSMNTGELDLLFTYREVQWV